MGSDKPKQEIGTMTCTWCNESYTSEISKGAFGYRVLKCPKCNGSIYLGLTRGWRQFWIVIAILTCIAELYSNFTLRDGFFWIPAGIGLLSFILLFYDLHFRNRAHKKSLQDLNTDGTYPKVQAEELAKLSSSKSESVSPWYAAGLSILSVLTLLSTVVGLGMSAGYETKIVDLDSAAPVYSFNGFDLVPAEGDAGKICDSGEDYWACTSMHTTMWNSLCTGPFANRTPQAQAKCDDLESFIDRAWDKYRSCGYGCLTAGSTWGYDYYRPEPTLVQIPGHPEITHIEKCYFDLLGIKIGYCPRK